MNSKATEAKAQISQLLNGLELACADESKYICLRLARQAVYNFDNLTRYGHVSGHDMFDVMAPLQGILHHPEATIAQVSIVNVALECSLILTKSSDNPSEHPGTDDVTDQPLQPAGTSQLDYDTPLEHGGKIALRVLHQVAGDIESLADALHAQANTIEDDGALTEGTLVRTYASRIKSLNSLVLSFVGPDPAITLDAAYTVIHGTALGTDVLAKHLEWERQEALEARPDTTEQDFMRGLRLALEILKAGESIKDTHSDKSELAAKYRGGAAQNNYALPFVKLLIENPQMAEGFAATFSGLFAAHLMPPHSELAELTYFDIHRVLTAEEAEALVEAESKEQDEAAKKETQRAPKKPSAAKAPKKSRSRAAVAA